MRRQAVTRAAYSFIELLITMMVIGVLAGVAAPRYSDALSATRVDAAARRVAADLRYARAEALRTSQPRTLEFSIATGEYELLGVADVDRPNQPHRVSLSKSPYGVEVVSVVFGAAASVTFSVDGDPSATGEVRLRCGEHRVAVVVDTLGQPTLASW